MIVSLPFSLPLVSSGGVFGGELLPRVTGSQYWIYSFYIHHDLDSHNIIGILSQNPYKVLLELLVPEEIDRTFTSYGRRDLCVLSPVGGNIYIQARHSAMVAGLIQYELLRAGPGALSAETEQAEPGQAEEPSEQAQESVTDGE
jgi:hypothetical protein